MQVQQEKEQLQQQVAILERQNQALWADLKTCQKSQSSRAQVTELERAYAVLLAEVRERRRREQVLQGQAQVLTRTLESLIGEPDLNQFLGRVLVEIVQQMGESGGALWLYDGAIDVFQLHLTYENGQIQPATEAPYPIHTDHTHRSLEQMQQLREHKAIILDREYLTTTPGAAAYRAYVEEKGIQSVLAVPLFLGPELLGSCTVRSTSRTTYTPEEIDLAHALAQQAVLAIQTTRLAEKAKQTAVAREQEKAAQERAAELAKANEALRRCLDRLAGEPDLDSILHHILSEIVVQLDARGLAVFHYDTAAHTLNLCNTFGANTAPTPDMDPDELKSFMTPVPADITPYWQELLQARAPMVLDANNPAHVHLFWPNTREWHLRWNQPISVGAPMLLGDEVLGFLGLTFEGTVALTPEQLSLAQALTHQATLAIKLMRLAQEAREAAIAREQEKAALERAAELAKANAVLRQSIDALTAQPEIEAFLGVTLRSIAEVLEVPSACLWEYEDGLAYLKLVYQDQQIIPAGQSQHPNAKIPIYTAAYGDSGKLRTQPFYYLLDDPAIPPEDEVRRMLQSLGVRCLLIAPIVIADRAVGTITARLTHTMPDPSPARLELVSTLTNQAALALQMAELAEEAKQAVVLEERNRMAGEIHDTLAQAFTGISIQVGMAQKLVTASPNDTYQILDRVLSLAQTGLAEARRSVWALHPTADEYADLARNLQVCLHRQTGGLPMQVELELFGTPCPVPAVVGHNLLRIAQEGINNAIKHARATQLRVRLIYKATTIGLSIQDNGRGFEPNSENGGFGLMSMSERASRISGQFTLRSQPGQGAEIHVKAPI